MSNQHKHSDAAPTAIVTGANRGIGFGVVRQLADRGYRVILAARDENRGRTAAGEIDAAADQLEVRQLDVASEQSIAEFARGLDDDKKSIDVLVNNAGVAIEGFDATVARRTMDTNFYGPVRLTDAVLPFMPEGARVVMVSSGAGTLSILSPELQRLFTAEDLTREKLFALVEQFVDDVAQGRHSEEGWPSSCYGVSKAALNAFVRISAPKLAEQGVAINAVGPGWVRTDMGGQNASRSIEEGAASVVHGVLIDPEETGGFYRDGRRIPW
ncbi:MAG: SDR family NAD(P)-dependent oxidoreductase [Spirochaetota bacterium]